MFNDSFESNFKYVNLGFIDEINFVSLSLLNSNISIVHEYYFLSDGKKFG